MAGKFITYYKDGSKSQAVKEGSPRIKMLERDGWATKSSSKAKKKPTPKKKKKNG